ncbi:MAG: HEPN domain-containing protein [Candidatus Eremiobacterota bacterium]
MSQSGDLKVHLKLMVSKSIRSLSSAKKSFNEGDYDFASSRAYYAVFYLIEAMLL